MTSLKYAIIDIETTGGRSLADNKVTDISVFVHDGKEVIDEFHSLVNPERRIPYNIVQLTGITDDMVKDAPKFYEIAKDFLAVVKETVFVAHNVSFDYTIIKNEFKTLGYDYDAERMCTVKLSRKILPGHSSYSLGKICSDLGIQINGRHRAEGDARATVELFELLMATNIEEFQKPVNKINRTNGNLPPLLDKEIYKSLPQEAGVYYFRNGDGDIIYIGKAVNIKQRVQSHFNEKSKKEMRMFQQIAGITYEITGDELTALLLESDEIKKHLPIFNRAQRRSREPVGISYYINKEGVVQLFIVSNTKKHKPRISFHSTKEARGFLQHLVDEHELCPKYCGLEKSTSACFNSHLRKCHGVCKGSEPVDAYNERVLASIADHEPIQGNLVIHGAAHEQDKKSMIIIENGVYSGIAVVPIDYTFSSPPALAPFLRPMLNTKNAHKIIKSYLVRNQDRITETFEYTPVGVQFSLF